MLFSKTALIIIVTSHEVPSFLHASMTFWYLPRGTILIAYLLSKGMYVPMVNGIALRPLFCFY
ncbi:MAG: hypothetical protein K0S91_1087 [Nitrososphaeraceae archaeon]|nr:hypothetical protein [Nitrososphaeraceae archaeon]